MTVLTQPRPGDTGEILLDEPADGFTIVNRPLTPPPAAAVDEGQSTTRIGVADMEELGLPPMRLPDADETRETAFIEPAAVPTGAELVVADRLPDAELLPSPLTQPVPPLPPPPPEPAPVDDLAAAQPVGPLWRVLDRGRPRPAARTTWLERLHYQPTHRAAGRSSSEIVQAGLADHLAGARDGGEGGA